MATDEPTDLMQVRPLTEAQARRLTAKIKTNLGSLFTNVARAYAGRAWEPLGYSTWAEYVEAELAGTDRWALPKGVDREQVIRTLHAAGMDQRQIADITSVSQPTVSRTLNPPRSPVRVKIVPQPEEEPRRVRVKIVPQPEEEPRRVRVEIVPQPEEEPRRVRVVFVGDEDGEHPSGQGALSAGSAYSSEYADAAPTVPATTIPFAAWAQLLPQVTLGVDPDEGLRLWRLRLDETLAPSNDEELSVARRISSELRMLLDYL